MTFVDTPGLGSLATSGAVQTLAYLPRSDHGTLLIDASAPLGDEDLTVLALLRDAGIATSVLPSKADLLTAGDLGTVQEYVLRQIRDRLHADLSVRCVSSVPTHAALLDGWLHEEVRPLVGKARAQADVALERKLRPRRHPCPRRALLARSLRRVLCKRTATWARNTLAGLRRHFDSESRPLLARQAVLPAPPLDGAAADTLRSDLAWLRENARAAPSHPVPLSPPVVAARQE